VTYGIGHGAYDELGAELACLGHIAAGSPWIFLIECENP
jgi:hypothetical protein